LSGIRRLISIDAITPDSTAVRVCDSLQGAVWPIWFCNHWFCDHLTSNHVRVFPAFGVAPAITSRSEKMLAIYINYK
jgi:hypothetical protein